MRKNLLIMLAIMIAIAFAAPSSFATSPVKNTSPDKKACFYSAGPPLDYMSIVTKRVSGTVSLIGGKVKGAQVIGYAWVGNAALQLTGNATAIKGKNKLSDGTNVKWKINSAQMTGGVGSEFMTILLVWSDNTDTGPQTRKFEIYDYQGNPVSHSMTKVDCKALEKVR